MRKFAVRTGLDDILGRLGRDWLPTIVGLAQGATTRNKALDGYDIWRAITEPATPSPRLEILHNINPACGMGFVNPNAGIRVGDWKLLVDCFNTSTLAPSKQRFPCHIPVIPCSGAKGDGIMLYNIAEDPEERSDLAAQQPAKVEELLRRMAFYGNSSDQVPPTLFWPKAPTGHGVRPWNYQCPQCPHSDALVDSEGRRHWDPWCDHVQCGVGPPAPAAPVLTTAARRRRRRRLGRWRLGQQR